MGPISPTATAADTHSPQSPIDPISRVCPLPIYSATLRRLTIPQQIFERTNLSHKHNSGSVHVSSGASDVPLARTSTDNTSLRRIDSTASSKLTKDKK
jgi:hypothetical protein